ncbi:MAG: LysM peptidoglycan-binding domain-containing protein [Gammaproteobacteria bacterium]|nr:LysM peptidoglycan-binding domain-containing protein [Gammaproteobacteria bacterium]MCW8986130.1 LysM peptidoglycan-binding domain-containing protein [Gammaproteobacteria bacterium]MCW9030631.1 LysM peptidoglycan-binding domain-containing protein [Gammaproteobacteria bacterium]
MKFNKMLKLTGLLGAFTLAVGCAGPAEKAEEQPAAEPETPTVEAAPVETSSAADTSSYEVNKGDHLWGISGKSYGNPYNWPLIYKANSDKIKDADLIYPGQVFDIESNPSDADSAAAVNHAKTRGSWSIGVTEESDKAYLAQ